MTLKDKVILITGGSRGIGLAIAQRAAQDGACIAIAAKTTEPHATLPGTIYTACEDINRRGGQSLPLKMDIRFVDQIEAAVQETVKQFGKIDILINNASAISLTNTQNTDAHTFDLMHQINVRGTYLMSRACIPHMNSKSFNHILMLAPPLNLNPKWFKNNLAYTLSKYGMSLCTLGLAEEFKSRNIMVNALWPKTTIATAATQMLGGDALIQSCRTPQIVADAAYWILTQNDVGLTGNFFIDEDIIITHYPNQDLSHYQVNPQHKLTADYFID